MCSLLSSYEEFVYDCFFVPYVETRDKLLKARNEIKEMKAISKNSRKSQGILKIIRYKR